MQDLIDGRCGWCGTDELYTSYHDREWGRLVTDDRLLLEMLILESAQAGLSWYTILKRREGYREAFCQFDPEQIIKLTEADVERLLTSGNIIRHRLKIQATISNTKLFLEVQKEFGSFYRYILSFFPEGKPLVNQWATLAEVPVTSPEAVAISRDMKRRGFKFFGATICYAFLQATGFVNDHLVGCHARGR